VALAESAIGDGENPLGIEVELHDELPANALLFGEAQSRVIVSCSSGDEVELLERMERSGVPAAAIGRVGPANGRFRLGTRAGSIDEEIATLARLYFGAIPRRMDGSPQEVDVALHTTVENA
jgi:phosphoribosylformylglycinamidine synthase